MEEQVKIEPAATEYLGALKSVRLAKTLAWLLIWLALAVQVTCFVLVQFTSVFEFAKQDTALAASAPAARTMPAEAAATPPRGPTQPAVAPPAATAPSAATKPGAAGAGDNADAFYRRELASWILPITKFVGLAAGVALVVFLLGAMQLSIAGRLGGAAGFSSAFVWSVVLLLALVPWQQFFSGMAGCGVLCDFQELQAAVARSASNQSLLAASSYPWMIQTGLYARFLIYPFVVLMFWIILGLRFAQGMKKVNEATSVSPPPQN